MGGGVRTYIFTGSEDTRWAYFTQVFHNQYIIHIFPSNGTYLSPIFSKCFTYFPVSREYLEGWCSPPSLPWGPGKAPGGVPRHPGRVAHRGVGDGAAAAGRPLGPLGGGRAAGRAPNRLPPPAASATVARGCGAGPPHRAPGVAPAPRPPPAAGPLGHGLHQCAAGPGGGAVCPLQGSPGGAGAVEDGSGEVIAGGRGGGQLSVRQSP